MKAIADLKYGSPDALQFKEVEKTASRDDGRTEAWAELERGVYAALETYSNVHWGGRHNSMVSRFSRLRCNFRVLRGTRA